MPGQSLITAAAFSSLLCVSKAAGQNIAGKYKSCCLLSQENSKGQEEGGGFLETC